jgi:transcriptional regulator with XRE-family HTH domain
MPKRDKVDGRSQAGRDAYTNAQRKAIGRNARRIRQQQRMTQTQLGREIGRASSDYIRHIENNYMYVMPDTVRAIAAALGVTEADLLKEE